MLKKEGRVFEDFKTIKLKSLAKIWNYWLDKALKIAEGQAQLPLPGNNLGVWIDISRY